MLFLNNNLRNIRDFNIILLILSNESWENKTKIYISFSYLLTKIIIFLKSEGSEYA